MDWSRRWAPYDEDTYQAVLAQIGPEDVVFDIGAGDLRLSRRMAVRARRVYAVELQPSLVRRGLAAGPLPANVHVLVADARRVAIPPGVTVGVLLMRHCPAAEVALYIRKLRAAGARRLLTNARWGLGVELVDLTVSRRPYDQVAIGWYACACGAVGFVPGPPEALTDAVLAQVREVVACPACMARAEPVPHALGPAIEALTSTGK